MSSLPISLLPEWAPQSALWVGWPRLADEWSGLIEPARDEIAAFVKAAAAFQPIHLAIGDDDAEKAARDRGLHEVATLIRVPTGDIWLRDTGPIFSVQDDRLVALVPRFNGWGGKYAMPGDDRTGAAIAAHQGAEVFPSDLVLEGGAIDTDGETLLTTDECLLNANRNDFRDRDEAAQAFGALMDVTAFQWVENGLFNDHTDGHIDNAARFVGPGRVVCQSPEGEDDPHRERLDAIRAQLEESGLDVVTVPSPGLVGDALPASHMNFTILNGAVIVPTYGTSTADAAVAAIQALFPDRTVIGLPAASILSGGGGAFHCMTREVPALSKESGR